MIYSASIQSEDERQIVLRQSSGTIVPLAFLAVMCLLPVMFIADGLGIALIPVGLWFVWLACYRVRIRFDTPPGRLTIVRGTFGTKKQVVTPSEALGLRESTHLEYTRVSDYSGVASAVNRIRIPSGGGRSVDIMVGEDPLLLEYLEERIRSWAESQLSAS